MPHDNMKNQLGPLMAEPKDSGGSDQDTNKETGRDQTPSGKKEEE